MEEKRGLMQRLKAGEDVICAEGYIFEFERRGYLKAGAFVPEVVIEQPHLVQNMYEEFVHCGSDVIEAFTYYGHRQKLKIIGREAEIEQLNRKALQMARKVANATGTLMAGNISNTTIYDPNYPESIGKCREIFKEQITWAAQEKADFIIAETFMTYGEAELALKCIKEYAPGLPAVITMIPVPNFHTTEGIPLAEALQKLEEQGADVVGLNCSRGPDSILPAIKEIRAQCKGPIACLPVPYRTTMDAKTFFDLKDQRTGKRSFPVDLDSWLCSRSHISDFTQELKELGVQYMGLCCGNRATYIRAMAEALGRKPPASKFSPEMSQHLSQIKGDEYGFTRGVLDKELLNIKQ